MPPDETPEPKSLQQRIDELESIAAMQFYQIKHLTEQVTRLETLQTEQQKQEPPALPPVDTPVFRSTVISAHSMIPDYVSFEERLEALCILHETLCKLWRKEPG